MELDERDLAVRILEACRARRWADAADHRGQLAILCDGRAPGSAVPQTLRRAARLAEDHPDTAARLHALALALWDRAGRADEAAVEARLLHAVGGPIVVGPLLLDRMLGEGAHSEVWAGRHGAAEVPVAVKVIKGLSRHAGAALENELRAVARLDHPHIVRLIDSGHVDAAAAALRADWPTGTPVLVLERARRGSLQDKVATLPWPACHRLLLQVLDALAHAHARGLLHLDIKPGNVLLDGSDARLADFGMAQLRAFDGKEGRIGGTPAYMAPEQLKGEAWRMGPATDLYAVGALAAALVQGKPPFVSEDLQETFRMHVEAPVPPLAPVMPVPDGLEPWIRRAMAKDPSDRFPCAADAARALATLEPTSPSSWRGSRVAPRPLLDETLGLFELREPPLVGREHERSHLWAALRRAAERRETQTVVVEGTPGIGVSRLLRWLGEHADELGAATVLRITGEPDEEPELPLVRMMIGALGLAGTSGAQLRARLEAALRPLDVHDPVELDALAAILDGRWREDHAHRLCTRWLQRLARRRAVLLCIDDAQWAGSVLRWVVELAEAQLPLLVVLGVSAETDELGATIPLALGPLPPEAMADLARSLLPLESTVRTHLVDASAGHPGTLVDLLADAVARRVLRRGPRGFVLVPGARFELRSAGDGLPVPDRATVLAAALGPTVSHELWRQACEQAGVEPDPSGLVALARARLLTEQPGSWRFDRPQVREHLLEGADRDLLRACAAVLAPGHEVKRASLLQAAGDQDEAAEAWRAAADRFEQQGRVDEALVALDHLEAVLRARGCPDDDERWARAWLGRAGLCLMRRDPAGAEPLLDRLEACPAWERFRGDIGLRRADLAYQRGDVDSWGRQLEALLDWFEARGQARRVALVEHRLGVLARMKDDLEASRRHLERAIALTEASGGQAASMRNSLGNTLQRLGDSEAAFVEFTSVAERDTGVARIDALVNLGHLCEGDDPEAALRYFERARRLAEVQGFSPLVGSIFAIGLLCRLERFEHAATLIRDLLPVARLAPVHQQAPLAAAQLLVEVDAPDPLFHELLVRLDALLATPSDGPVRDLLQQAARRARSLGLHDRADRLYGRSMGTQSSSPGHP